MTSGIYCIKNIHNNKTYIGQSINIEKRWRDHLYALNHDMHDNKDLQKDWKHYGKSCFSFFILEELPQRFLLVAEEWWIKHLDSKNNGYNFTDGGLGVKGIIPWNLNKEHSQETRKKISEKAKLRIGKKNPFYGKTHSKETREKISKSKCIPVVDLSTGKIYSSAKEADKFFGGHSSNIAKMLHGQCKTAYGRKWAYLSELNSIENG